MDYTRNYGEVSGSVAVAKGYEQSALWIPQGLEQVTATVLEVPADVQSLALVWQKPRIKLSLNWRMSA